MYISIYAGHPSMKKLQRLAHLQLCSLLSLLPRLLAFCLCKGWAASCAEIMVAVHPPGFLRAKALGMPFPWGLERRLQEGEEGGRKKARKRPLESASEAVKKCIGGR